MDFAPKRESKSQLGWFKDFKIFSGRNIVRVAHQSGMKINGCSCSFVFAVFNNLNKTRVRVRSFVFNILRKTHVRVRSCSIFSPKVRVRVLVAFMFVFDIVL